ncbi:hypothetical protein BY996DRAFT_6903022 [Phakopsora pachyrhizi]|nr:hypothetical protein BY996DRAFT_6903022 [Phakopsora pachyrhizi]
MKPMNHFNENFERGDSNFNTYGSSQNINEAKDSEDLDNSKINDESVPSNDADHSARSIDSFSPSKRSGIQTDSKSSSSAVNVRGGSIVLHARQEQKLKALASIQLAEGKDAAARPPFHGGFARPDEHGDKQEVKSKDGAYDAKAEDLLHPKANRYNRRNKLINTFPGIVNSYLFEWEPENSTPPLSRRQKIEDDTQARNITGLPANTTLFNGSVFNRTSSHNLTADDSSKLNRTTINDTVIHNPIVKAPDGRIRRRQESSNSFFDVPVDSTNFFDNSSSLPSNRTHRNRPPLSRFDGSRNSNSFPFPTRNVSSTFTNGSWATGDTTNSIVNGGTTTNSSDTIGNRTASFDNPGTTTNTSVIPGNITGSINDK